MVTPRRTTTSGWGSARALLARPDVVLAGGDLQGQRLRRDVPGARLRDVRSSRTMRTAPGRRPPRRSGRRDVLVAHGPSGAPRPRASSSGVLRLLRLPCARGLRPARSDRPDRRPAAGLVVTGAPWLSPVGSVAREPAPTACRTQQPAPRTRAPGPRVQYTHAAQAPRSAGADHTGHGRPQIGARRAPDCSARGPYDRAMDLPDAPCGLVRRPRARAALARRRTRRRGR